MSSLRLHLLQDHRRIASYIALRYDPAREPLGTPLQPTAYRYKRWISTSRLLHEITETVQRHIGDLTHAALPLSGGLDSSTMLYTCLKLRPDLKLTCFSMGFGEQEDEIADAEIVADHFGVPLKTRTVKPMEDFEQAVKAMNEPKRNVWCYLLAKFIASHSLDAVVLDGLGGDEALGGYAFRYRRLMELLFSQPFHRAYLLAAHPLEPLHRAGEILTFNVPDFSAFFHPPSFISPMDAAQLLDYNFKALKDFTPQGRLFHVHGLTVRQPFMDVEFQGFCARIPFHLKYDAGVGKKILREALRSILPRRILEKPKRGFAPSSLLYVWRNGLAEKASELTDGILSSMKMIRRSRVKRILEDSTPEPWEINLIWNLYALEVFLRAS